jgi:hypothetical protein
MGKPKAYYFEGQGDPENIKRIEAKLKQQHTKQGERKIEFISDIQFAALCSILKIGGVSYEELAAEAFSVKGINKTVPPKRKLTYEEAVVVVRYGNRKYRKEPSEQVLDVPIKHTQQGERKMAEAKMLTEEMVSAIWKEHDDFNTLYDALVKETSNENLPKLRVKNLATEMMMEGKLEFKQLDNWKAKASTGTGKAKVQYAYWGTKGINIPNHLVEGLGLDIKQDNFNSPEGKGNTQLEPTQYGTCFKVGKSPSGKIMLEPDTSFDADHKKVVDDAWSARKKKMDDKATASAPEVIEE